MLLTTMDTILLLYYYISSQAFSTIFFIIIFNLFIQSSRFPCPLIVPHPILASPPYCHLQEDVPTSTPLYQTSPLPGSSLLSRVRCIFSHWAQTQQSSSVYMLGASYQLVFATWLVAQCPFSTMLYYIFLFKMHTHRFKLHVLLLSPSFAVSSLINSTICKNPTYMTILIMYDNIKFLFPCLHNINSTSNCPIYLILK